MELTGSDKEQGRRTEGLRTRTSRGRKESLCEKRRASNEHARCIKRSSPISLGYGENKRGVILTLASVIIVLVLLSSCFTFAVSATAQGTNDKISYAEMKADYERIQSSSCMDNSTSSANIPDYQEAMRFFIENRGQFDSSVKFVAVTEFGKALFYDSKVQYLLERYEDGNLSGTDVVTLTFPGSAMINPQGQEVLSHYTNYFVGDPSTWVSGAKNYRSITYQEMWPGIDLTYRFSEKGLKYEFAVDPYVSEQRIEVQVEGAAVYCEPRSLTFDTGTRCLVDGDLTVTQNAIHQDLSAQFLATSNVISFKVEGRDTSKALLIDPLIYSTYLGGSGEDHGQGIAVDANGNTYITGYTNSGDFPTSSPYQAGIGGNWDAFVLKLNAAGSTLAYSTYIGGNAGDFGFGIAVDASGNAYVVGCTFSANFPTFNPYQAAIGGNLDAFVLKLNAAGSALVYSTYLGGSGEDHGDGIAVDASGNAYVVGSTPSTDFPTFSPFQANNGGGWDAIVLKFNAAGSALLYSTYIGGSGNDQGLGIAIDASGNAYVTGFTGVATYFPTFNPYQAAYGGNWDAFALKLNATGSALVYSTFIGGSGDDRGFGIAVDASGNAYVTGSTTSTNFPTSNPYQAANAGGSDVFVLKFNAAGSALVYSTYIGGSGDDRGNGIAVDANENAYVTGDAASTNFANSNAYQASNGGGIDAFLLKMGVLSVPTEPVDLQVSPSNGKVVLSWHTPAFDGNAPITHFKIYRSTTSGGETLLATVGNVLTYDDTTITHQAYYYFVAAVNSIGEGIFSSEAGPVTPYTAPGVPTGLTATPGNAQVVLNWAPPLDSGGREIINYKIYRGTSSSAETYLTSVPNVLAYTDNDRTNGVTYFYKISAVNAVAEGGWSGEASATPISVPTAPTLALATPGNAQVVLVWTAPSSNGGSLITNYKLYRGTTSGGETFLTMVGNFLTYTDPGLTNGQIYYYKVSALNDVGDGSQSNELSATPATVPSAPTLTSATPGNSEVALVWTAPSSNGGSSITNYKLYRGTTSGGETLLATSGNVLTYTDNSLTNGQTYYYTVTAVNPAGEGPFSNELNAEPFGSPTAPQNLQAIPGDAFINLTWQAPINNGGSAITNYQVWRGLSTGAETFFANAGLELWFNDTGLTNGQTY